MDVVHSSQREFVPTSLSHRSSGLAFKILFEGSEEDRPNNHQVALVKQYDFFSPVHKHNFDQIRYAWKGDFSIGSSTTIKEGELCYHPEGVHYGPQSDDGTERILYIIQFGGASRQGYVGHPKMKEANRELEKVGRFEGGKFYPAEGNPIDGYQALWEHVNQGKKLKYPAPRYHSPILMTPENFEWTSWTKEGKSKTAHKKLLGTFSERGTVAQQIKLDASGYLDILALDAFQFLIVRDGSGSIQAGASGAESLVIEDAVRLHPAQGARLSSEEGITLLHYIIPII